MTETCWILDEFCDHVKERKIKDLDKQDAWNAKFSRPAAERFASKEDALREMMARSERKLEKAKSDVVRAEARVKKCRKKLTAEFRL